VRLGVAVNKLAAHALAGGEVTAVVLSAVAQATGRSVDRMEEAAATAARLLA